MNRINFSQRVWRPRCSSSIRRLRQAWISFPAHLPVTAGTSSSTQTTGVPSPIVTLTVTLSPLRKSLEVKVLLLGVTDVTEVTVFSILSNRHTVLIS
jgi:hypothetical protein